MNSPLPAVLRRLHRSSLPPPSPPPRSVYDDCGNPWPVEPDQRLRIIGRDGRPTESSPARLVRTGELVEFDPNTVTTVRGQLI